MPKPETALFRTGEEHAMKLCLTDTQQENIKKALKRGIYKELHKRGILSSAQLNELIERNI